MDNVVAIPASPIHPRAVSGINRLPGMVVNVLYRLAGADADTMAASTPAARAKFIALGMLVVIVFGVAWAGMGHLIAEIDGFHDIAWRMGLVWGCFWAVIEVLIISSARSYGVSTARKSAAFLLRAALGIIPVLTFSTIWFIETNRPEIRVAIETLRIERESGSLNQIAASLGTTEANRTLDSIKSELDAIRQKESEVPPAVLALSAQVNRARAELRAAENRFAPQIAQARRQLTSELAANADEMSNPRIESLRSQISRATSEIQSKSAIFNSLNDRVQEVKTAYLIDLAKKREALESGMVEATRRASEVNATFDKRSSDVKQATGQAAKDNFSGLLTGMMLVLQEDTGKKIQFAFWFIALFMIEVAAIAVKMFFVTDADVALANNQMVNIARCEHAARIQLAKIEADAANAICQADWEKQAFRPEDTKMAATIAKLEADALLREKERALSVAASVSQATAGFEALTAYREALTTNRDEVERERKRMRSKHDAQIINDLFVAAETTASDAIRRVINGQQKAARGASAA